jgi:sugar lactone lactonase YvrE
VHSDLSAFGASLNDMVALPDGRVYVDVYLQRGGGPPQGDLALVAPDGICVDVEGGVWVGCFLSGEFVRVVDGGEITHRVPVGESWAVAPALGGPEMRTLHLVVSDTTFAGLATGESTCRIETVEVDVPGAGSP